MNGTTLITVGGGASGGHDLDGVLDDDNLVAVAVGSGYDTGDFLNQSTSSEWGARRNIYVAAPLTALYALILLLGLAGNVSTCVVIARNRHMHTVTNYYLFSLAVSDLLLLVCGLPQEIYHTWSQYPYVFGDAWCVLVGFAAETSANATVLTITAFTVERYVAICHPFQAHTMSKLSRAVKLVLAIWVVALGLAAPQAAQLGVVPAARNPDLTACTIKHAVFPHSFEIATVLFFVAPMTVITVLYVLIALRLRAAARRPRGVAGGGAGPGSAMGDMGYEDPGDPAVRAAHRGTRPVIKMLVAVVVAFFVCWAPFHAQRLVAVHADPEREPQVALYVVLTHISGVLYYLSTTVNPLLYHLMSHKFRRAFKVTLFGPLGARRPRRVRVHRCRLPHRRPLVVTFRRPGMLNDGATGGIITSGGVGDRVSSGEEDGDVLVGGDITEKGGGSGRSTMSESSIGTAVSVMERRTPRLCGNGVKTTSPTLATVTAIAFATPVATVTATALPRSATCPALAMRPLPVKL